jgi:hypothetical protein
MKKNKIRIKGNPTSKEKFSNFDEMSLQYKTSNPLKYKNENPNMGKDSVVSKDGEHMDIGIAYPSVPEEYANMEAEKNELIYKVNKGQLFKIGGKSHSKGGTDLIAEDGDFIFSNKIKLKGDFLKTEFGLKGDKEYSVAEIAKKYLSVNKFDELSKSSNSAEKKTANLMLSKLHSKLSKLSMFQELHKGFPNGVPNTDASQSPSIEVPLMKYGGSYEIGGPWSGDKTGNKKNASKYNKDQWDTFAKDVGFHGENNKELQEYLYANPGIRPLIDKAHGSDGLGAPIGGMFDGKLGARWDTIYDSYYANRPPKADEKTGWINEGKVDPNLPSGQMFYNVGDNEGKVDPNLPSGPTGRNWNYQGKVDPNLPDGPMSYKVGNNEGKVDPNLPSGPTGRNWTNEGKVDPNLPNGKMSTSADKQSNTVDPDTGLQVPDVGKGKTSEFRNLGFSTPEQMALANSIMNLFGMPINEPVRQENYGLQQGLGIMSNMTPYNMQSSINEANRTASIMGRSNNAISPNAQMASARNAQLAGTLAEKTSEIKGAEYNQNAQLENANRQAIATLLGSIGQDKEVQAGIYNDKVNQLKENLWGNKMAARRSLVAEYAGADKNRQTRNAMDYYLQSVAPNYKMQNANGAFAFSASEHPFDFINQMFGSNQASSSTDLSAIAKEISTAFPGLSEEKIAELAIQKLKSTNRTS